LIIHTYYVNEGVLIIKQLDHFMHKQEQSK